MAATGLGFASLASFWPLLIVAFVGTLNPSSGDVSVFLPLEHARLAGAAEGNARTALFARYSVLGALCAAFGALAAGVPDGLVQAAGFRQPDVMRAMFLLYGALGLAVFRLSQVRHRTYRFSDCGLVQRREFDRPLFYPRAVVAASRARIAGIIVPGHYTFE